MDVDVGLSSPNKRVDDYSDVLTKNPRKMARIEKVLKAQGECEYRPFSLDGEDYLPEKISRTVNRKRMAFFETARIYLRHPNTFRYG